MIISQISVFIENKSGKLRRITEILAKANIDIRALSIADTTDFGILRLIVSDPVKAETILRAEGMTVKDTRVIGVALDDKPGSLHHVLEILSGAGIGVEYAYAFITRKSSDAYVIFRVEDIDGAIKLLTGKGMRLLRAEEVYSI